MKLTLKVKQDFEVLYLSAKVGARYTEDATVNGVEDTEGNLMPCFDGKNWCPMIEIETGKIINWEQGKTASVHYKSCDENNFYLLDEHKSIVSELEGYVIGMMCPKENGYGDYVIMDIDENGFIKDFKADLSEFKKKVN